MINRIVCLVFCLAINVYGNEEEARHILKNVRERSDSLMPIEISFNQKTIVYPLFNTKESAEEYYRQNNQEKGARAKLNRGSIDHEDSIQNQIEMNTKIHQSDSELLVKCFDYDHYLHIRNSDHSAGYTLLAPDYLAIYNVSLKSINIEPNRTVGRDYIPIFHFELPLVKLEQAKEIHSAIVDDGTCEFSVQTEEGEYKLGVDAITHLPVYSIFDIQTKAYAYYYKYYERINDVLVPRQVVYNVLEIHPLTKKKYIKIQMIYTVDVCTLSPEMTKNDITFSIPDGVKIYDQRTNKHDVIKLQENQMIDFKNYMVNN